MSLLNLNKKQKTKPNKTNKVTIRVNKATKFSKRKKNKPIYKK